MDISRQLGRDTRNHTMAKSIRRVAVIGAGPAGAIATDALIKEQTFDTIRVFERRNAVGGTWYVVSASCPIRNQRAKTYLASGSMTRI